MYYPKQIPYILNKRFRELISYQEYHREKLEDYCMCIWTMKSKKILNTKIQNAILPDACIDIVINFSDKTINFSGFSRETELLQMNDPIDYLGVRLKPGAFYTLFHRSADSVMDKMISFSEIEKEINLQEILFSSSIEEKMDILEKYLIKKMKNAIDKNFIDIVNYLYRSPQEQNVRKIAKDFCYDKRQLLRVFKVHYGVSPKVLLNILRLHLCLTLLLEEKKELCDIATMCGFYDQSHFIKEIKRYTGISPINLIESYKK